jgi:hypothetical protein
MGFLVEHENRLRTGASACSKKAQKKLKKKLATVLALQLDGMLATKSRFKPFKKN